MSLEEAEEYREDSLLRYSEENANTRNVLEDLIYNTNVSSIGIGAINFDSDIEFIEEDLGCFAFYNDYYNFCIRSCDNMIVCITKDVSDLHVVCNTANQFLSFLYLYNCYDRFITRKIISGENLSIEFEKLVKEGFSKRWIDELIDLKGIF
ncbi:hypothetical protein [Chitinophaga varians]|uniref:hypothetical protein n=1 Tax=Chitinophaga varians TaxID=2202339 RepID=UPI00165F9184|nr:hypothetical protein [Chitinophaga varians]MBC9914076.1 hypothetical protein [Chitinophaga varians]